VGDANNAVVFQPGERFCVDHPAGAGNTGVTIRFEPTFCRDTSIFERGSWTVPASAWAQVNALAAELGRPTSHDVPDVEARVVALLAHWLSTREPSRTTERRSERDRVRCAQSHLNDVLDRPVSLRELGALVDWSPWHLVRAFQRHTGVSPYRYHLRLRLRAAMCEMMRGRAELTAIALRAGFSSHSHFTQAFRREFGAPPSAMMRSLRADG
jgi:AraC-like DNA-binding protein